MPSAVLPKHVAAVIRCQRDPLRALDMFRSVEKEDGYKHTALTYKCLIEKLGSGGKFDAMEAAMEEMRQCIDRASLEGVYVAAMKIYGKKRKVQEAVDIFEKMEFFDCRPTVYSHNVVMNILVENDFFTQAHKLYLMMKDKGIAPDVHTYTIRIKSFCRTNRPQAALRLLNNMPSQGCEFNSVAYCTVVSGFYQQGFRINARGLFVQMVGVGIVPDVATFNKLIHILCKNGDVSETEVLLDKVLKRGFVPNLFTLNIFIQGLCKKGLTGEAVRMLEVGRIKDAVTYNTLICGLSKESKVEEAEKYLRRMVNGGFEPDAFTYNSIVDGYCRLGMMQKADGILRDASSRGGFVPDEFTYCSLLRGCFESGDFDRALSVFLEAARKGMKRNVVLFNGLVEGLCRNGLVLESLRMVKEMEEEGGFRPDSCTYNVIVNSMCKLGCLSDADMFLEDAAKKGFLPDVFTFNTLIDGYCKKSKIDAALGVVRRMCDHGVEPDVVTYNTMLDGICKKTSNPDDVLESFRAMILETGCAPNAVTYNVVMESFCRSGNVDMAAKFLAEFRRNGLSPDSVTFATLIDGLCRKRDLDGALDLFRRMEEDHKISPAVSTYNILINAFSEKLRMETAAQLFDEMVVSGCQPDNYTYRCMIDGFCMAADVDSGCEYLLEAVGKGLVPSPTSFGRVLNWLCRRRRSRRAARVVGVMVEKGIVPEAAKAIFEADKRGVAAPKMVVDDLFEKRHITCEAHEMLTEALRENKKKKKKNKAVGEKQMSGSRKKMNRAFEKGKKIQ
ncbi:hypothetical protein M569_04785 [Genlisea aurea]|uniref:Pentacotripeptide-repeat region of PRORP domain-containing protein n=1 Tax=Genlisea aurea TaxID=192259 RepID=S8E2S3_9LAMI|nr:hypothetical protein M569_04785 [Genlisea aurea]